MKIREETNRVVFHHSLSQDVSAETIKGWHISKGWDDIGYHFVIRQDGVIETGRDLKYIGAHAKGKNRDSIGVCLTGDFSKTSPSNFQIESSCALYTSECEKNDKKLSIQFHREVINPCPGKNLDRTYFREQLIKARNTLKKRSNKMLYRPATTIEKGIKEGFSGGTIAILLCYIAKQLGVELSQDQAIALSVSFGVLTGAWKSFWNWKKNHKK